MPFSSRNEGLNCVSMTFQVSSHLTKCMKFDLSSPVDICRAGVVQVEAVLNVLDPASQMYPFSFRDLMFPPT